MDKEGVHKRPVTDASLKEATMSGVFAYCRVSTGDQTTDSQVEEIAGTGFGVTLQRTITEIVSGSVAASVRKGFGQLLPHLLH